MSHVRFGSKADMCSALVDVRYGPIADIEKQKRPQQRANSGGISLPVLALSRQKTIRQTKLESTPPLAPRIERPSASDKAIDSNKDPQQLKLTKSG
jgi:hypothetical protein